ncbi:MAG: hypothetical protein HQL07_19170 [Nitrospirae bacterium]|nr:hypothetical protein [Magnetococcales bacterium]
MMRITRMLYERGFTSQQIVDLFRFIDWVLNLPEELDNQFWTNLSNFEENKKMPYITSVERIGHKRGKEEGRHDGKADTLLKQMRRKFGQTPDWVTEKVNSARLELIEVWSENVLFANSVDEVFADRH